MTNASENDQTMNLPPPNPVIPLDIAVVGTGISGMAAAWLLSKHHRVTVYESAGRLGGHSNTVNVPSPEGLIPVDTGFIVYNEATYPNLIALLKELKVPTQATIMSFAVSFDEGRFEYGGESLKTLFAQPTNIMRPRFWRMLYDLQRFYRTAPADIAILEEKLTSLGDYLAAKGYSSAFQDEHLLPMAAAIWSAPLEKLRDYPAAAFLRFCQNHGLLKFSGRPEWRTITGGSQVYIKQLTAPYAAGIRLNHAVQSIRRSADGVWVSTRQSGSERFDHVVIAAHADHALGMLQEPTAAETALLGAFDYEQNLAVLHSDARLMPKRQAVWSSWNYMAERQAHAETGLSVTYWMNRLQRLASSKPLFVTLNPHRPVKPDQVIRSETYHHPVFNSAAITAQRRLWQLQGQGNVWFCGAYFGSGFHEDGLQSGLAVAEAIGGVRRPWIVPDESGRIHLAERAAAGLMEAAA